MTKIAKSTTCKIDITDACKLSTAEACQLNTAAEVCKLSTTETCQLNTAAEVCKLSTTETCQLNIAEVRKLSITEVYELLFGHYGPQHWWPAETPFEVMIGAILTQNTNWLNVEKAIRNLKPYLQPQTLHTLCETDGQRFTELIRPCGYYNIKTTRVRNFLRWFAAYDFDLDRLKNTDTDVLRKELLEVKGIGRETADSILLYAIGKPVFVIDAYTRRLFGNLGFELPKNYEGIRTLFESQLESQLESEFGQSHPTTLYKEYHALIVRHCKDKCRSVPLCVSCFLFVS